VFPRFEWLKKWCRNVIAATTQDFLTGILVAEPQARFVGLKRLYSDESKKVGRRHEVQYERI
jgi:hypothetical protein